MDVVGVIQLLGGLALFLFGMSILGDSLEAVSGGKLERILERLTGNLFFAVLLGAVVTGLIQSSSATTVIVVGLVNAKSLKLRNAIGVIMGANIGTTVTSQILRLTDLQGDSVLLQLLKPTALAPLAAFAGIVIFMTAKRSSAKNTGSIFLGFGILFTGMFNMEAAVRPLSAMPEFEQIFSTLSNPLLGVVAGAVVTAIIQSSSASIGILQALSSTGQITCAAAFPIIMGQNIGTCITPILASIGASKNAKRSAVVHLSFNVIGTVLFLAATYLVEYTIGIPFWNDVITKGGIANFHTLFNVAVTILFMPFARLLEKLACAIVRDKEALHETSASTVTLETRLLATPVLAIAQGQKAVASVAATAEEMLADAAALIDRYDGKGFERVKECENTIDKMDDKLGAYLLALSERELGEENSRAVSELLHSMSEVEQMGDSIQKIAECCNELYEKKLSFSESARGELDHIAGAVKEIVALTVKLLTTREKAYVVRIEALEEIIDSLEARLKDRHVERLQEGVCSTGTAFVFINLISFFEKIADNCSNLGVCLLAYGGGASQINRHAYSKKIHSGDIEGYAAQLEKYKAQYLTAV